MARKDQSLKPHNINAETWWYEEIDGIEVYHREPRPDGTIATINFVIKWKQIEDALKRKNA